MSRRTTSLILAAALCAAGLSGLQASQEVRPRAEARPAPVGPDRGALDGVRERLRTRVVDRLRAEARRQGLQVDGRSALISVTAGGLVAGLGATGDPEPFAESFRADANDGEPEFPDASDVAPATDGETVGIVLLAGDLARRPEVGSEEVYRLVRRPYDGTVELRDAEDRPAGSFPLLLAAPGPSTAEAVGAPPPVDVRAGEGAAPVRSPSSDRWRSPPWKAWAGAYAAVLCGLLSGG